MNENFVVLYVEQYLILKKLSYTCMSQSSYHLCDAMMHVLKDFINLKYSELLTEEISKSN